MAEEGIHFGDRSTQELEDYLCEFMVKAILATAPVGGFTADDVAERTQKLIKISQEAHYDLGISKMEIRDKLQKWSKLISMGIKIDLDKQFPVRRTAPEGGIQSSRRAGRNGRTPVE